MKTLAFMYYELDASYLGLGWKTYFFGLQIHKSVNFYEYNFMSIFFTLFFYRLQKYVVDETTNIDRVGYAYYKYDLKKKYYCFLLLIYFCLHVYQNPRINIFLISAIKFSRLNHYSNELYASLEENHTYDI